MPQSTDAITCQKWNKKNLNRIMIRFFNVLAMCFPFIVCNYNSLSRESIEVMMPLKLQHKERPAWEGKLSAILTCDMMTYLWRGWSQSEMTLRQSPTWRCSSERQQDSGAPIQMRSLMSGVNQIMASFIKLFLVWKEMQSKGQGSLLSRGWGGGEGVQHINFATRWFLDSEFTLAWSSAEEWI